MKGCLLDEGRKRALLIAASILATRELSQIDGSVQRQNSASLIQFRTQRRACARLTKDGPPLRQSVKEPATRFAIQPETQE